MIVPCNWLQHYENMPDAFHVPILHGAFSGVQFVAQMGIMPKVKWEYSPIGVKTISARVLDDGRVHYRITEAALPTLRVVPNPRVERYAGVESLGWTLPIDDTHFRIYVAGRVKSEGRARRQALAHERQALGGPDRGGASEVPGRLGGAGRPGADHACIPTSISRPATRAS